MCNRCEKPFVCTPEAIATCDCNKIELTFEETQFVAGQFKDCVCNACLKELKAQYAKEVAAN